MISRTLLGVALVSAVPASPQSQTKTERGLRLNADGSVRISNLVGSVHVTGWNRDSVSLPATLPQGDHVFRGGGRRGVRIFGEPLNDRNPQPTRLDVMVPMRAKVWVKTATAEIE